MRHAVLLESEGHVVAALDGLGAMPRDELAAEVDSIAAGNPPSEAWVSACFPPETVSWLMGETETPAEEATA